MTIHNGDIEVTVVSDLSYQFLANKFRISEEDIMKAGTGGKRRIIDAYYQKAFDAFKSNCRRGVENRNFEEEMILFEQNIIPYNSQLAKIRLFTHDGRQITFIIEGPAMGSCIFLNKKVEMATRKQKFWEKFINFFRIDSELLT